MTDYLHKVVQSGEAQGPILLPPPRSKRVRNTYDALSESWGDIKKTIHRINWGEDNRIMIEVRSQLRDLANNGFPVVADFGCGPGKQLEQCLKIMDSGYCIGIDISPDMVFRAENKLGVVAGDKGIALLTICSDASSTPLPDASVDLCYAKMLLHHVPKPIAVLREMARITRPKGHVIVMVPGCNYQASVSVGDGEWFSQFPSIQDDPIHDPLGRFSVRYLQEISSQVGLLVPHVDVDQFEYQFSTVNDYLRFMKLTGADSKTRGYVNTNWIDTYDRIIQKTNRDVRLRGEFITLIAIKDM